MGGQRGGFCERIKMAVENANLRKRDVHRVTFKRRDKALKDTGECKLVAGWHVVRQYQMEICRKSLEIKESNV